MKCSINTEGTTHKGAFKLASTKWNIYGMFYYEKCNWHDEINVEFKITFWILFGLSLQST